MQLAAPLDGPCLDRRAPFENGILSVALPTPRRLPAAPLTAPDNAIATRLAFYKTIGLVNTMTNRNPESPLRRRGRPRKDQTLPQAPRAHLLKVGVAVLTEKGFSAVGIDEILSRAGIPKGSFYHYFSSKDDFGLELIDSYAAYFARKLDRWLLDESLAPLARLIAFCDDARAGMERYEFRRGCLVGNLGQEMGVLPEPFRARLIGVLEDWEARTAACLVAARSAGEISADTDCGRLAQAFWIGWEGAVLRAKLERHSAPIDIYVANFLASVHH